MFNKPIRIRKNIYHSIITLKILTHNSHKEFILKIPSMGILTSNAWNTQDINWNDQDWLFNAE